MASLASFTRSAARATSSAYRRLPIRWRLAGGSAALTLVILLRLRRDRRRAHRRGGIHVGLRPPGRRRGRRARSAQARAASSTADRARPVRDHACPIANLDDYAAPAGRGRARSSPSTAAPYRSLARRAVPRARRARSRRTSTATASSRAPLPVDRHSFERLLYVQYARRLSDVEATAARVQLLPRPRRARRRRARAAGRPGHRPARDVADRRAHRGRAHDRAHARPVAAHPHARGRRRGRRARAHARGACCARSTRRAAETEAALSRQREFVADASHELRTPLTVACSPTSSCSRRSSTGEQRETAASALRSTRRMRRLVADLLLLARADAGRTARTSRSTSSDVVIEAAGELEPVAGDHALAVDARAGRDRRRRARRAAPPRAQPDGERAQAHRPGHRDPRAVERDGGDVVLRRRGRRPGRPARAARDRSSSASSAAPPTAAGRAASASRSSARSPRPTAARVALEEPLDGRGARFVVRLPAVGCEREPRHRSGPNVEPCVRGVGALPLYGLDAVLEPKRPIGNWLDRCAGRLSDSWIRELDNRPRVGSRKTRRTVADQTTRRDRCCSATWRRAHHGWRDAHMGFALLEGSVRMALTTSAIGRPLVVRNA